MRGSAIATWAMAVVAGIVVADVLIHPQGTAAAGNAANNVLVPSYAALLGTVPGYNSQKAS